MHWLPRLSFALTLILVWFIPVPAQPSSTAGYDAARVLAHAQQLSTTIRAAASVEEHQAAQYIADQFASYGLLVEQQSFPVWNRGAQGVSYNVIARLPGEEGYGTIYIGAHYDSIDLGPTSPFRSPGANDNASGVAVLLEVARLLASEELKPTIAFVAFGSEEVGLAGSGYFVSRLPTLERLLALGMLNMDCVAVGDHQSISTIEGGDPVLVERARLVATTPITDTWTSWGDSDHRRFADAGIPVALVQTRASGGGCGPDYHKASDTAEKLDPAHMERVAQIVLATTRSLAEDAPLRQPTQIWFPGIR